jgi:general stress protein 26
MAALVRKEEEAIYFLTDAGSEKITEIGEGKSIQLTFSHKGADEFFDTEGDATVSDDRDKIADLWTMAAKAYWDSADDQQYVWSRIGHSFGTAQIRSSE